MDTKMEEEFKREFNHSTTSKQKDQCQQQQQLNTESPASQLNRSKNLTCRRVVAAETRKDKHNNRQEKDGEEEYEAANKIMQQHQQQRQSSAEGGARRSAGIILAAAAGAAVRQRRSVTISGSSSRSQQQAAQVQGARPLMSVGALISAASIVLMLATSTYFILADAQQIVVDDSSAQAPSPTTSAATISNSLPPPSYAQSSRAQQQQPTTTSGGASTRLARSIDGSSSNQLMLGHHQPIMPEAVYVSSLSQDGGSGYSAAADNFIGGGASPLNDQPIYLQSKRARKISAFMPMRGRKDGRDSAMLQQQQQLAEREQDNNNNNNNNQELLMLNSRGFRESEAAEPSILGLVSASLMADEQQQLQRQQPMSSSPLHWSPSARNQFANQFAIRHMLLGQQQQQQPPQAMPVAMRFTSSQINGGVGESADMGAGGQFLADPLAVSSSLGGFALGGGSNGNALIMQAKPRRAFHPMRGKKSSSPSSSTWQAQQFYDQLMGTNM